MNGARDGARTRDLRRDRVSPNIMNSKALPTPACENMPQNDQKLENNLGPPCPKIKTPALGATEAGAASVVVGNRSGIASKNLNSTIRCFASITSYMVARDLLVEVLNGKVRQGQKDQLPTRR